MFGFILGLLMGFLGALAFLGFLAYWLCSRPNNLAVAKFINGIAQALAHKPVPGKEAWEEATGKRKEKQGGDRP